MKQNEYQPRKATPAKAIYTTRGIVEQITTAADSAVKNITIAADNAQQTITASADEACKHLSATAERKMNELSNAIRTIPQTIPVDPDCMAAFNKAQTNMEEVSNMVHIAFQKELDKFRKWAIYVIAIVIMSAAMCGIGIFATVMAEHRVEKMEKIEQQ